MVAILFVIFFMGTILLIMNEPKREELIEPEPEISDTIYDVTPIDTTIGMNNKPWPVKVVRVESNTNEFIEGEWVITTENGLTYYTNEIVHVGQIAFYLNSNGEIIKNYGTNKLDSREWR